MKLTPFPFIIFALLALTLLGAIDVRGASQKKVLFFSSEGIYVPSVRMYDQAFREAFARNGIDQVQFYVESLEESRIPTADYEREEVTLLREKYKTATFDCILAIGTPALRFLLKYENELFPNAPKVYSLLDERSLAGLDLGKNTTGVAGSMQFEPTVDLILTQHPSTRTIAVVTGSAPLDNRLLERAQAELRLYDRKVNFQFLSALTIEELKGAIASLPPDTVVYFLSFAMDRDGNGFSYPTAVSHVASTSSVPIYGSLDTGMGTGIVGGNLISFEMGSRMAGDIAARILAGAKPSDIPPVAAPNVPMFDWRELQRWKIDANALPPGSVVRFRELSVWEQYKGYFVAVFLLILLQTLLIASMLYNKRRRRRAEFERGQFKTIAAEEHDRLVDVLANVPGIVWESRTVDDTGRRRAIFISGHVEQMLGYSVEECLADPDFIASKIVPEDREAYGRQADSVFMTGEPKRVQFRCATKGGGWKWAESHMMPVRDDAGHTIGLRGVTLDITERKKAEETLSAKERQLTEAQRLAQVGSWEWNSATGAVTWSEEIYRIYGLDPTKPAASYSDHSRLFTPESWDRLQAAVNDALVNGRPYEVELEIVRTDGRHAWGSARGEAINEEGVTQLRGTLQDITARKKAEEAVRESENRFRNLADTAPVKLWMAGPDMGLTFFNQSFLNYTGKTMEEVLGEGWLRLIHDDDREHYIRAYSVASEGRNRFTTEFRVRRADGEYRWVYETAAPRFTIDGEFLGYIGSFVDISDRKVAEDGLKVALQQIYELKNQLHEENVYLKEFIKLEHHFGDIVGTSDALKYVLFKIEQVAPTDSTVLITGETGTGKELVARAIHGTSIRKDHPLVKVNCAALAPSLIESELFGHERGAFTGASTRKIGRFEMADGATIFLDEIGELPLELQAKLLRLIQEGEFERLGSTKTLKVDVRIMAATNRNLEAEVRAGRFREDLLFRLNVFPVTVPPLRERKEDIPVLVEYFVNQFSKKLGRTITSVSPASLRSLNQYHWPGNVRELANVIERAVIGTSSDTLRILDQLGTPKLISEEVPDFPESLESIERKHIIKTLQKTGWRIQGPEGAARILGVNPSTLRTRMNKLGIIRKDSRGSNFLRT